MIKLDKTPTNSIKYWSEQDRPREKLLDFGAAVLSNAELIAILIGSGSRELSAVDLARNILKSVDNDLNKLCRLDVSELAKFKGIGNAKAVSIVSALELGKRRRAAAENNDPRILTSKDAFELLKDKLSDLKHEEFWIALLSRSNKVIATHNISKGGVSGTVVDVRIILKLAINKLASGIILYHNHPSGNLQASGGDKAITKKLSEAGQLIEINVLDHIIVGGSSYMSFADKGLL